MGKTFKFNLSAKGLDKAIKEVQAYKKDIIEKTKRLAQRLAEEGVIVAKLKISEHSAVYTGELLNSMNLRAGDTFQYGASWSVYTGCPWAKFVEFGTGVVGAENPHPDVSIAGWRYDTNEHGESGWFYFKEGSWHWTKGLPSRPFMYETSIELTKKVTEIAKEVFER